MKPSLLSRGAPRDDGPAPDEFALERDLHLEPLFRAMSGQDKFLSEACKRVLLRTETDLEAIRYRQQVLKDALRHPEIVDRLYALASEVSSKSAEYRAKMKPNFARTIPVRERLRVAVELLPALLDSLEELRDAGARHAESLSSEGFLDFFERLQNNYPDAFFREARDHLARLRQVERRGGVKIGASVGDGFHGTDVVLRSLDARPTAALRDRLLKGYGLFKAEHSLRDMEESALGNVLHILKRFIDDALGDFDSLRYESGFYVGCVQLHRELTVRGCPVSFPTAYSADERVLVFHDLYDPGLALRLPHRPIGNDLTGESACLFIVTGANQGGKSTFLRSIGLAQLMMQCGMFVPASRFEANVCDRIVTYFAGSESQSAGGTLEEELRGLNRLVERSTPHSLLLMNEPFAAIAERDGATVGRHWLAACCELQLKVVLVSHNFELANWAFEELTPQALFLSPVRNDDGRRTYRMTRCQPVRSSFGEDLFRSLIENAN
ncbi:hypothetical protein FE782_10575 [Paenibacillus antri]|uniref:DNA mismatch repair proteins mutS family domain-containing protein n=1 Tax=Paenibacillus antri TaxID=2582848 RepID=A0A5R9GGG8_9BACL|nr:hypothetical protein [Paenibacillus antri]TLS52404.1 hypothetical protein FE782_10575 [Paenibacillus antri]